MVLMRKEMELKPKRADVGDVTRKDVVEAIAVRESEPLKGIIFRLQR